MRALVSICARCAKLEPGPFCGFHSAASARQLARQVRSARATFSRAWPRRRRRRARVGFSGSFACKCARSCAPSRRAERELEEALGEGEQVKEKRAKVAKRQDQSWRLLIENFPRRDFATLARSIKRRHTFAGRWPSYCSRTCARRAQIECSPLESKPLGGGEGGGHAFVGRRWERLMSARGARFSRSLFLSRSSQHDTYPLL